MKMINHTNTFNSKVSIKKRQSCSVTPLSTVLPTWKQSPKISTKKARLFLPPTCDMSTINNNIEYVVKRKESQTPKLNVQYKRVSDEDLSKMFPKSANTLNAIRKHNLFLKYKNESIKNNKHYNILGIIREGQFFTVGYHDPHVILYNNFNKESRIVSFYGIQSITQPENHAELQSKYGAEYYYKLDDYDYTWGWNLQLPAEFDMSSNKANIIDSYYTIYIYIPEYSTERKYNYIDAETVPYSNLPHTTYITKEEWDEAFGYTYDCLMKVLIYKLGLN